MKNDDIVMLEEMIFSTMNLGTKVVDRHRGMNHIRPAISQKAPGLKSDSRALRGPRGPSELPETLFHSLFLPTKVHALSRSHRTVGGKISSYSFSSKGF